MFARTAHVQCSQALARISWQTTPRRASLLVNHCRKRGLSGIGVQDNIGFSMTTPCRHIQLYPQLCSYRSFQQQPTLTISNGVRRTFSARPRKNNSKTSDVLCNEELLLQLRRKFPSARGPGDIQVRLVTDEGPEQPATVQVCSLAEAIEMSLDRMTDLIAVALQNDPPVIRAAGLSKLEYQKEQASAKQKAATKAKQKKEFRFRAGIDVHDLTRKIQDMEKFLGKGMECEYTVFSKARTLRENSSAGQQLVDQIQELLSHCAVLKKAPLPNEKGNLIHVHLAPKKA